MSTPTKTKFILMGSPGAGKGTLAVELAARGVEHLSTGDLFRAEIERKTPLGGRIKTALDRGELAPDELTLGLMRKWFWGRPAGRGFVLDGFPRTLIQARCFDEWLEARNEVLSACVFLELGEEATVKRLSGRRICPWDGRVYHIEHRPPAIEETCDDCGGSLVRREDDAETVVRRRYRLYLKKSRPVAKYYRDQGLLRFYDADRRPAEIVSDLLSAYQPTPTIS